MEIIFHEKVCTFRDGMWMNNGNFVTRSNKDRCALQGPYFTAVDLAAIGHRFDEEERARMAEAGVSSEEYNRFLQVFISYCHSMDVKTKFNLAGTFIECGR